jgi:hypothetical protein
MKDTLNGFSAIFEEISNEGIDPEKVLGGGNEPEIDENGNVKYSEKLDRLPSGDEPDMTPDDLDIEPDKDDDDEPEEKISTEEDEPAETGDEATALFFDAIAEAAGWEDIDAEAKPKTPEELIEYFKDVISENSKPQYANDDVAALDEFVRNGGKMEDFIKASGEFDYDNIDTSNEYMQKRVVSEFLSKKGFSEAQISRKLEKYEDAEILEDEAKDAIESLKEMAQEDKKTLLEEQKKSRALAEQEQQKFVDTVMSEIEAMDNVRGIKIPKEDKKALTNYLFNVESDGRTKYQKDYAKSTKNLIESAYFTMKGDSLLNSAKKSGETTATDKFRQAIKTTGLGKSKQPISTGASAPLWTLASKSLLA